MATYSPESLKIKAPTGGFQTGGFYSGRQFWGGTLGEPGEFHPSNTQSGQQGAAYVAPKDVAYIAAERAKPSPTPTTKEEVSPYLANFQDALFKTSTAPETKVPTMEEVKAELAPTTPAPTLLDRVGEFEKLRTTYGVADLEESLTDIKDQIKAEQDAVRKARGIEEGKPIPLGVIQGRVTEEERVANERLDALGRQQSRITDDLNTKYNIINLYMGFKGLDYQDAVSVYDKEFTRNLQMYDIIVGARKETRSAYEYEQTAARTNLQIYANAAISGNVDYSSLSADQKLMISKLEVQSGLPIGFIGSIKKDPKSDIIFTSTNEGVTQVGFRNADGTVSVQSYGTRTPGTTSDVKAVRAQFGEAATIKSNNRFPDLVEKFANTMSLDEIYSAYANSEMGRKYGTPIESAQIIKLVYKVASGEMTEEDAKEELGL